MSLKSYDIVITPTKDLGDKAINQSQKLEQLGTHFTLKYGEYFPHSSLFMLQLDSENLQSVLDAIQAIANKTQTLDVTATNYDQKMQYFDVEYAATPQLRQLQDETITACNPLRVGTRPKVLERMKDAEGLKLKNFEMFGYDAVGELYRPHITFTRFTRDQDIDRLDMPALDTFNGQFTKLCMFEMGDNGTCIREVASFELQSKKEMK